MVWSVEKTRWPVSAAVSAISMVSRSRISPTRITFGACRSDALSASGERRRVAVQLALMDGRLLVVMQELDRILDGEDVLGPGLVDQIDDRGERRGLAGAGRAGDQDDAVLERGGLGQHRRKIELGEGRNPRRDDAHHDREGAALAEDVDAEPAAVRQRVREIAGPLILEGLAAPSRCRGSARRRCAPCPRAAAAAARARPPAVRWPCFSTCGGRPGENTRSLIPLPESSMAPINAAVETTGGEAGVSPVAGAGVGGAPVVIPPQSNRVRGPRSAVRGS